MKQLADGASTWSNPAMDSYVVADDISIQSGSEGGPNMCRLRLPRQYSVFLCRLTAHDLVRLKSRLYDIIDLHED